MGKITQKEIDEIKKDCEYEKFHQYVMWGQEQNKKNPGKFGTMEMYYYLINHIRILALSLNEKEFKEYLKGLSDDVKF